LIAIALAFLQTVKVHHCLELALAPWADIFKATLLYRIQTSESSHRFMFADQGEWRTVAEGVQIKILRQESDSRSALVKMAANSFIPAHQHDFDEVAIMLEGEVWLEDILCGIEDYHLAHACNAHGEIRTDRGCLLFIRSA
jgi:hypothetical protein